MRTSIKILASLGLAVVAIAQSGFFFGSNFTAGGVAACTATVTQDGPGTVTRITALPDTMGGAATTDANTALVVILSYDGSNSATVTGCTWNSVAMTQIGTPAHNTTSTGFVSLWYVLNPATGSHAFNCTTASVTEYHIGDIVFHNVNASTPIRSGSYTVSNAGDSPTLTISSNTQDLTVSGVSSASSLTGSNQGAGTFSTSSAGTLFAGQGYGAAATTVSFTWTATGNVAAAGTSMQCK